MRPLSNSEIIQIWERGFSQHPLRQAMILLVAACPEMKAEELMALTLGQRDEYLLRLRELTFGSRLNGFVKCPSCGDRLELSLNTADIRVPDRSIQPEYFLDLGEIELRFRLLNSQDLAAIAGDREPLKARQKLVQRCILQAKLNGKSIEPDELPEIAIVALAQHLAECDPNAEVLLNLTCPGCKHQWQTLFDIATFFISEIAALSKRLLREVHTLASAYGWSEADILAMTHPRRQFYLEMVGI